MASGCSRRGRGLLRGGVSNAGARLRALAVGLFAIALTLSACGSEGEYFLVLPQVGKQESHVYLCSGATLVLVTPLQTDIGSGGDLHAQASDQRVAFSWTGTRGLKISNSKYPDASFTCVKSGKQTATLQAS